jgi:hypothetical protein
METMGLKQLPPEVALPGVLPLAFMATEEPQMNSQPASGSFSSSAGGRRFISSSGAVLNVSNEDAILANTVHVWAAYRESKTLYEIEPPLVECLSHSPWPADTPTTALRLSSRCPVLAIPWHDEGPLYVAATYDLVNGGQESGSLVLRLSILSLDQHVWMAASALALIGSTLNDCIEAAVEQVRWSGKPKNLAKDLRNEIAGRALTILLYLAGDPDIVRSVHPGEKPIKEKLARTDPERYRDLREPTTYAVGKSFARAIERWEIEHERELNDPTSKTVRPHMRRAHSHLYWTGEGREIPRVKFLLPISVKGGNVVEEPEQPKGATVR